MATRDPVTPWSSIMLITSRNSDQSLAPPTRAVIVIHHTPPCTDKSGGTLAGKQSEDSSQVAEDSGAEEGDEEEEEGDTTSDEENLDGKEDVSTLDSASKDTQQGGVRSPDVRTKSEDREVKRGNVPERGRRHLTQDQDIRNPSVVNIEGRQTRHGGEEKTQSWKSHQSMPTSSSGSSSSSSGSSGGSGGSRGHYKYSSKLSPPVIPPSPGLALNLDPQMALVMSTMPLALLSKAKNPSSPGLDPAMAYFSLAAQRHEEDQPLDLSKKPERSPSFSAAVAREKGPSSRTRSSSGSSANSSAAANGFSSLQSLQQRFGGDYPLELSQKSGAAVIPLQPSINHKSGMAPHPVSVPTDAMIRASMSKPKSCSRSEWLEKQEPRTSASSPVPKGDSSRHTSPMLPEEQTVDVAGKHTIHRCSCQKSFSTLYALSIHLQETGHAPGSSKAASLMDYPKLVRGQDMWLNQESEQTRRILRCMQCGESFKSLPLLTVHMMQTQHYTKIVSSDHGRRSHKCSTYCDRELDKECIFKCKVCHEAFTDMEGLANHMIVSGHHKKQSSRQLPNPGPAAFAEVAGGISSAMARHGRRKRFLPEEMSAVAAAGASPSTVASLLDYRRKQSISNGFHSDSKNNHESRSPDSRPIKLVLCDSCGKRVEAQDFDSHVRACLRQRAEVIDALKSKLAAEEALLSRSESKLLRSGFSLSSVSGLHDDFHPEAGQLGKGFPANDDQESQFESHSKRDGADYSTKVKTELPSPGRSQSQSSPSLHSVKKNNETSVKICDLIEVPLKKWYGSADENQRSKETEESGQGDSEFSRDPSKAPEVKASSAEEKDRDICRRIKQEDTESVPSPDSKSSSSPLMTGIKRKLSDTDSMREDLSKGREKNQRLSPNLVHDSNEESMDFTSSALHKLDMFSRGLKFSPPRRNISPDTKIPSQHSAKLSRRKDSPVTGHPSSSRRDLSKSPMSVSPSPLSHLKTESPDQPKKEVTFDIIDPNAGSEDHESSSSALEAMESFIHKSFSAKSDIRTSNLATMFSPFRNCFPLPGSLPGQSGIMTDSSDPALSHFAKFSKFFRMVPGIPPFPDVATAHAMEGNKLAGPSPSSSMSIDSRLDKVASLNKKQVAKPHVSSSAIKVPVVKFPQETPPLPTSIDNLKSSGVKKSIDNIHSSKKYKYSTLNSHEALRLHAKNHKLEVETAHLARGTSHPKDFSDMSKEENLLPSSSDLEKLTEELRRKRRKEYENDDGEDTSVKKKSVKTESVEDEELDIHSLDEKIETSDGDTCIKVKKEKCMVEKDADCEDDNNDGDENTDEKCADEKNLHPEGADQSPEVCSKEIHTKSTSKVPKCDEKTNVTSSNVMEEEEGDKQKKCEEESSRDPGFRKCSSKGKCGDKDNVSFLDQEDESCVNNNEDESQSKAVAAYDDDDKLENKECDSVKSESKAMESEDSKAQHNFAKNKSLQDSLSTTEEDEECSASKDDFDDEEGTVLSGKEQSKKADVSGMDSDVDDNDDFRKGKVLDKDSSDVNVAEDNIDNKSNGDDHEDEGDMDTKKERNKFCSYKHFSKGERADQRSIEPSCSLKNEDSEMEDEGDAENKDDIGKEKEEKSSLSPVKLTAKSGEKYLTIVKEESRSPSCDSMEKCQTSPYDCKSIDSPSSSKYVGEREDNSDPSDTKKEEKLSDQEKRKKKSALDSLSSFVYSQPLTSEHPLDSLQRLLSTNDLTHISSADPHNKHSAASSHKCLTPDLSGSTPLNLTTKGGGGVSSGGCSSDDNEEGDLGVTEGGASEGDVSEYKCAACNRRFASKGSYRYHLSRCHLSSVKKYGIKEAFNMSPYVYLPLDHTAKFSKYYQMAHELANKGK